MKKRIEKKLANRRLTDVVEIVFHDHLQGTDLCQETLRRLPNGRWYNVDRPEVISSSLDVIIDLRGVRRYADQNSCHGELWYEFNMADGSSHTVTC